MVCLGRPYQFRFFEGCLPQNLLGTCFNTLTHILQRRNIYDKAFCEIIPIFPINLHNTFGRLFCVLMLINGECLSEFSISLCDALRDLVPFLQ